MYPESSHDLGAWLLFTSAWSIAFLFLLYWVIRAAVKGGMADAEADRRWRRRRGEPGPGHPEDPAT